MLKRLFAPHDLALLFLSVFFLGGSVAYSQWERTSRSDPDDVANTTNVSSPRNEVHDAYKEQQTRIASNNARVMAETRARADAALREAHARQANAEALAISNVVCPNANPNELVSYTYSNIRGDVVAKTNESGQLTYQASYEAFGAITQEQGFSADRQRANTKELDPTGLINEGERYFNPDAGVYISADLAGFVDGPNRYTYVKQNPWTYFDPEGLIIRNQKDYEAAKEAQSKGDPLYKDVTFVKGFDNKGNENLTWQTAKDIRTKGVADEERYVYDKGKLVYQGAIWFFDDDQHTKVVQNYFQRFADAAHLLKEGSFAIGLGSIGLSVPSMLARGGTNPVSLGNVSKGTSVATESGVLAKANFAQRTFSQAFSSEGAFAGRTVNDVAAALKSAQMRVTDVPIQYIVRDGNTLILNTRSAQALEAAGIPRAQWNAVNMAGNAPAEAR